MSARTAKMYSGAICMLAFSRHKTDWPAESWVTGGGSAVDGPCSLGGQTEDELLISPLPSPVTNNTQQQQQQPFNGPSSWTTQVSRHQNSQKH